MNIRGIELCDKLGLLSPRKRAVFWLGDELEPDFFSYLDFLYNGCPFDATILVFDYSEPLNQVPDFENNVRKYNIPRIDFFPSLGQLVVDLKKKVWDKAGRVVPDSDIKFLAHQSYNSEVVSFSGKSCRVLYDGDGFVEVVGVDFCRDADSPDLRYPFVYHCPVRGFRPWAVDEECSSSEFRPFAVRIMNTLLKIPLVVDGLRPFEVGLDFQVYSDTDSLFFNDLYVLD